jgi:hypothetical protein
MTRMPDEVLIYGGAYGVRDWSLGRALQESAVVGLDLLADARDLLREGFEFQNTILPNYLPDVFGPCYHAGFLTRFIDSYFTAGWKLAQPTALPFTNTAEELALWGITQGTRETEHPPDALVMTDFFAQAVGEAEFLDLFDPGNPAYEAAALATTDETTSREALRAWFRPFGTAQEFGTPHPGVWS